MEKTKKPIRQPFLCLVLLLSVLLNCTGVASAVVTQPAWPNTRADSAIVIHAETGEVLYSKNADSLLVPASMTKVMTAYIIFEELEAGRLTLDTMVPISDQNAAKSRNGATYPASVPLPYNTSVSVDMLLKLILIPSASASCIVMAEYISGTEEAFVQRMNETAQRLGMTADYKNCHGAQVHYITPRSQAILVRDFIQRFPQILEYTSMTGVSFNGGYYPNTNKLLPGSAYAYSGADGFKTGTIAAAGYCLSATAVRGEDRIISVVMHSDNDRTRHTDSQMILDYAFQVLEDRAVFPDITYHWSRDAVEELRNKGVELNTSPGNRFQPDRSITRAEFVAMLYSALEQQNALPHVSGPGHEVYFNDISGHWAEEYIDRAAKLGMVAGVEENKFAPDAPITRQAMMALSDRFLNLPDKNGLGFADDGAIAVWALESVARATAAGLFSGNDAGLLQPTKETSRGEAATVVVRILDYVA